MDKRIRLHRDQGVAMLTLNRPEAHNAFDLPMLAALHGTLGELAADNAIRVVLLQAEGANFSVGGDIREFQRMSRLPDEDKRAAFAAVLDEAQSISRVIREIPKPIVAAVQGTAAGFGFSLALAADFIVAAQNSRFIAAYCAIGTVPDGGLSLLLPPAIGYHRAADIMMLNRTVGATEAYGLGLLHSMVAADQLDASALALAVRLAHASVNALGRTKHLLVVAAQHELQSQLQAEREHFLQSIEHPDWDEGLAAFLTKRPARFYSEEGEYKCVC